MADFKGFAQRMRIRAGLVEENAGQLVRKVAIVIDQTVVMATPVDKGRARTNWRVGVGEAPTAVLPEPSSKEVGAAEALEQARDAMAGYQIGQGDVYISNNLPYIQSLNDGSSAQAPAGFVERAVAAGVAAVKGAKLLGN